MATVVPTAAQVRKQAFGRPKIVEALQLLGVDAHHKMGAKALKAQLLQLIEGGRRRRRRPAAGAGNPRARRGHLGGERVGGTYARRPRGIHAQRHHHQHAHSLPGAMGSLKPIDAQVATVRHDLHQNLGFADGCGELWRRRSRQLFAHPLLRSMCFPRWTENAHAMRGCRLP